ncbi:hypothetical protein ACTXT7_012183 [Hymenolepis weldensis]
MYRVRGSFSYQKLRAGIKIPSECVLISKRQQYENGVDSQPYWTKLRYTPVCRVDYWGRRTGAHSGYWLDQAIRSSVAIALGGDRQT